MASISTLVDRVKIYVQSSGTGPFELGGAIPAFRGVEALLDGTTYSYATENGSRFEAGTGVYNASLGVLVRSPIVSSNGGAAVAFPANIELAFTALAQDLIATGGTFPIINSLGGATDKAISQKATTDAVAGKVDASVLAAGNGANEVGFSQNVAADDGTALKKLQQTVYLDDFGAVGDAVTIDTPALAAAIAKLPNGGIIRGLPGKFYYLPSPPDIPKGVRLIGDNEPYTNVDGQVAAYSVGTNGLILDTQIKLSRGAEVSNWLIWQKDLVAATSAANALAKVAAFKNTAIEFIDRDCIARDNLIIGFATAIVSAGRERPQITGNAMDCTNGVNVSGVSDCGGDGVANNRCYPHFTVHQPWETAATKRRSGTAFYIHDTADGLTVGPNFDYGWATGLWLHSISFVKASHVCDNVGGTSPADAVGTIGIKTTGTMNCVTIDNSHVDSHETNYSLGHTAGFLQLGSNTSGGAGSTGTARQIKLGASSSGDFGRMVTRGATDQIIGVDSGVGMWAGVVVTDAVPSSGTVFSLANSADAPKLRIAANLLVGSSLTNTLNYGEPYSVSGVYTPTLTNQSNIAASTPYLCQYLRVGNCVTVSGRADVDPTAAGDAVLLMTLPIPSNFTALEDCGGVATNGNVALSPRISGNGGDVAQFDWTAVDITNRPLTFSFTYRIK